MDSQKDNNPEKEEKSLEKAEPLSFFTKDKNFIFIYKKTEKLVAAVYIISGLFPEEEPLRWSMRESAIELMSLTTSLKDKLSESTKSELIELIKSEILELVSLIEVSYFAGLLGEMNFSILKQEFSVLLNAVVSKTGDGLDSGKFLISPEFFSVGISEDEKDQEQGRISKGHLLRTNYIQSLKDNWNSSKSVGGPNADSSGSKTRSDSKGHSLRSEQGDSDGKKKKRKDVIIDLVKKKKEITVKDVSEVVKDCSEKTLQRDLISLVKNGVLKKEGERRWSRYSLA